MGAMNAAIAVGYVAGGLRAVHRRHARGHDRDRSVLALVLTGVFAGPAAASRQDRAGGSGRATGDGTGGRLSGYVFAFFGAAFFGAAFFTALVEDVVLFAAADVFFAPVFLARRLLRPGGRG